MKAYDNWCGNENITYYFYNEWQDPYIEYCGFRWSAPMIEGDLYNMMLEENLPDTGTQLAAYINTHVEDYLKELLYSLEDFNVDFIKENAPGWFEYLRDTLAYPESGGWRNVSDDEVIEKYTGVSFVLNDFVAF